MSRLLRREDGNATFITVFLLMPVIIGFFGLAVDTARARYAQQETQDNVQTAAVAAATQLSGISGLIDFDNAKSIAIQQYTNNRVNYGKNLRCATTTDLTGTDTLEGGACPWILVSFSVSADMKSVYMAVREYTPNAWISVAGFKEYTISVDAGAVISQN
jgi:uncharacterized membrane protein